VYTAVVGQIRSSFFFVTALVILATAGGQLSLNQHYNLLFDALYKAHTILFSLMTVFTYLSFIYFLQ
jgi:hypothetical protein